MAWTSSNRRSRLPSDWSVIRRRILRRDHGVCVLCSAPANQVDHILPGDDHSDDNLRALCPDCHNIKSSEEGHAAQAKLRSLLVRPAETPPWLVDPTEAKPLPRKGF